MRNSSSPALPVDAPAAIAEVLKPPPVEVAAVRCIFRSPHGSEYTVSVPVEGFSETPDGWLLTFTNGRSVRVYRPHVWMLEQQFFTMRVKPGEKAAQAESAVV